MFFPLQVDADHFGAIFCILFPGFFGSWLTDTVILFVCSFWEVISVSSSQSLRDTWDTCPVLSSQSCKHTAATNVQPKPRAKLLHASSFRICFGAFFWIKFRRHHANWIPRRSCVGLRMPQWPGEVDSSGFSISCVGRTQWNSESKWCRKPCFLPHGRLGFEKWMILFLAFFAVFILNLWILARIRYINCFDARVQVAGAAASVWQPKDQRSTRWGTGGSKFTECIRPTGNWN